MFFKKTVDSIVAQFTLMVQDLEDVEKLHTNDMDFHNKQVEYHAASATQSANEAARARSVADKIKHLFEVG